MGAPSDMGAGSRPRLGVPFQVNARSIRESSSSIKTISNVILGLRTRPFSAVTLYVTECNKATAGRSPRV
jgi:hypothetical protein